LNPDKIKNWAAAGIAILGLSAAVLWGVPYWMKTEVRGMVTTELEEQAVSTAVAEVEAIAKSNQATLSSVNATLERMEAAQMKRDQLFAEYLERQAARR